MRRSSADSIRTLSESSSEGKFYELEKIISKKNSNGSPQYLIKWKGWGSEHNTWEPLRNIQKCTEDLRLFEERWARRNLLKDSLSRSKKSVSKTYRYVPHQNSQKRCKRQRQIQLKKKNTPPKFQKITRVSLNKNQKYRVYVQLNNGSQQIWTIERVKKEIPIKFIDYLLSLGIKHTLSDE